MEQTAAFYKVDQDGIFHAAPNFVFGAYDEYTLRKEDKDTYILPIDGWYWFDSLEDAKEFFNIVD